MNQKTKLIIGGVVLAVLAFWAGTAYANHHASAKATAGEARMNGARGNFGGGMTGGTRGGANAGSFVNGTVLSKTDTTITVQNQAGGSKIILVSPTTAVSKSATGALSDIEVGSSVIATGSTNTDGSITAQSVQLRPTGQTGQRPLQ